MNGGGAPVTNTHPRTLQHTASSSNYQSIIEIAPETSVNNYFLQPDPLNLGFDPNSLAPSYKHTPNTTTAAHRTFSRDTENRNPSLLMP